MIDQVNKNHGGDDHDDFNIMKNGGDQKNKYSLVQIVGNALLIKTLHRGKIPETQKTIHEPVQDVAERATLFI